MSGRDLPVFGDKGARQILQQLCSEHGISLRLLQTLIAIQRNNLGRGKQMGISQEFSAVLNEFIESQDDADASR
jgi:hypothetical protein